MISRSFANNFRIFSSRVSEERPLNGIQSENIELVTMPPNERLNGFKEKTISECKDISEALQLLDFAMIKDELEKSSETLLLKIQLDQHFGTLRPNELQQLNKKCRNKSIVALFTSKNQDRFSIYWKSKEVQNFLILSPYNDSPAMTDENFFDFFAKFLADSLANGHLGLLSSILKSAEKGGNVELHLVADHRDYNLLLIAAESGRNDIVKILLDQNIDTALYKQGKEVKAQDLAWDTNHHDVVLTLMKTGVTFPTSFKLDESSEELREFCEKSEDFHLAVKEGNKTRIKEIINEAQDPHPFYNRHNESAAKNALIHKQLQIYEFLTTHKVFLGRNEILHDFWVSFSEIERETLRKIHFKNSIHKQEKHISDLTNCSSVSHDDKNAQSNLNLAQYAFGILNQITSIRIILMIVAASRKLNKIIFDFKSTSVNVVDPTADSNTRGLFYTKGIVYIAARFLVNQSTENETFGTLAHELCHYAMFLVYRNSARPYKSKDKESRQKFAKIFDICEQNRLKEKLIEKIFEYPRREQHAELIVRVPHLIALYHNQPEELKKVRENFKELFEYYELKVVSDMERALPRIVKEVQLMDSRIFKNKLISVVSVVLSIIFLIGGLLAMVLIFYKPLLSFNELSTNDKIRVENAPVIYKNVEVQFQNLFAKNSSVYQNLTSDHIYQMLDKKCLDFSDPHLYYLNNQVRHDWKHMTVKLKNKFLNSTFTFQNESLRFEELHEKIPNAYDFLTSEQIVDVLDGKKLIIDKMISRESDFYIERSFKQWYKHVGYGFVVYDFNNVLVQAEKSRMFVLSGEAGTGKTTTFKEFTIRIKKIFPTRWVSYIELKDLTKTYIGNTSLVDYSGTLKQVLGLSSKSEFEKKMFEELLEIRQVVLLWNGFDEISPANGTFFRNFTGWIHTNTSNIQYLCTRPIYKELFDTSYELIPFDEENQNKYLKEFYKSTEMSDKQSKNITDKIHKIFNEVNTGGSYKGSRDFNTPLMLKMIVELISNDVKINESENLWQIYEKFINTKIKYWEEQNVFAKKLTANIFTNHRTFVMMRMYQMYALKSEMPEMGCSLQLSSPKLKIMNQTIPNELTNHEISRMGIVHIDRGNTIKFVHKTYAEFFVAQFFIDNIYNAQNIDPEEGLLIVQMFYEVAKKSKHEQVVIINFIKYFLQTENDKISKPFDPTVAEVFRKQFRTFLFYFLSSAKIEVLKIFFNFFKKDHKLLVDLLQVNENETLYTASYNRAYFEDFKYDLNRTELKDFGKEYLTRNEYTKYVSGSNQKGIILFSLYIFNLDYVLKNKTRTVFHDEYDLDEKILQTENKSVAFELILKRNLTERDLKELLTSKSSPITWEGLYLIDNENFWSIVNNTLTHDEKRILISDFFRRISTIYYFFDSFSCSIFKKTEEILTKSEIYDIFLDQNILHLAASFQRYSKFFEYFWNFFVNHTDSIQQANIANREIYEECLNDDNFSLGKKCYTHPPLNLKQILENYDHCDILKGLKKYLKKCEECIHCGKRHGSTCIGFSVGNEMELDLTSK